MGNEDEKICAVHGKHAHHSEKIKKNILSRLNRIEGQVRGISKMVSEDVYCDDILNQLTSATAALNGIKKMLLEAHMRSCVAEQLEKGEYEVIDELITTIGKMLK